MKNLGIAGLALALMGGAAAAADLPGRGGAMAPSPVMVAPVFSWTGFYVGLNVGAGMSSTKVADHDEWWTYGAANYDKWGVVGGAQIGYNYQFGAGVIGIEADINASSMKGSYTEYDSFNARLETKTPWFGTIRARAGVAVNNALFYGTAGVAFIKQKNSACYIDDCSFDYYRTDMNKTNTGLAVGAGVEYALTNNWTVRGEYLYMYAPEKHTLNTDWSDSGDRTSWQTSYNVVRLGLNYKFGGGAVAVPVMARY